MSPIGPIKILAVVGPTSSGKSELAVRLARRFNGEIISADSRQIYRGMDLGTGKVPGRWISRHIHGRELYKRPVFVYKKAIHHLIDFANPKKQYSVALFQKQAQKIIRDIHCRGKIPIICGGTGHWVDAVAFNQTLPDVPPDYALRAKLEKKSADELYQKLIRLDPARAKTVDRFNKRRLIRALEIVITAGKPVPDWSRIKDKGLRIYNCLWLGLNLPQAQLYRKIDKRLKQRIKQGMIAEVKRLHQYSPPQNMGRVPRAKSRGGRGLSWKRLLNFGLEYKYISLYLQKKLTYDEMLAQLSYAIKHYAKRQVTWFKRNKDIHRIKNYSDAAKLSEKFIKN